MASFSARDPGAYFAVHERQKGPWKGAILAHQKRGGFSLFFPYWHIRTNYGLSMDYLWTIYGVSMAYPRTRNLFDPS